MKSQHFLGFALKVTLFYWITIGLCEKIQAQPNTPLATQPTVATEVKFRTVFDSLIVVSVKVNEVGPFDFLLDSGAQNSVVDTRVADQLSLAALSQTRETSLTDTRNVPISTPIKIALGPAEVVGLHAIIENMETPRQIDSRIAGILGQDFLSNFNYLLDYRGHTIRFDNEGAILSSLSGDRVPFDSSHCRMTLMAQADTWSGERAELRLLLDSGTNTMVLTNWSSRRIDSLVNGMALRTSPQVTSTGHASVRSGEFQALQVGSQRLHYIRVVLAVKPKTQLGEDGVVPMAIFHALYVNNHDKFVILNPKVPKG